MKLFKDQAQLFNNYDKELDRLEEIHKNNIEKIYQALLIFSSISADEAIEKLKKVNEDFHKRRVTLELNYARANMKVRGA